MTLSLTTQIIKTIGFLQKNGLKKSFKNVTMVTKMLHVYISVTVRDRPKKWAKNVFQKWNHGYKNVACLYLSNGAR